MISKSSGLHVGIFLANMWSTSWFLNQVISKTFYLSVVLMVCPKLLWFVGVNRDLETMGEVLESIVFIKRQIIKGS